MARLSIALALAASALMAACDDQADSGNAAPNPLASQAGASVPAAPGPQAPDPGVPPLSTTLPASTPESFFSGSTGSTGASAPAAKQNPTVFHRPGFDIGQGHFRHDHDDGLGRQHDHGDDSPPDDHVQPADPVEPDPAEDAVALCMPEPRKFFSDWAGTYTLQAQHSGAPSDLFVNAAPALVFIDPQTDIVTLQGQSGTLTFAFPAEEPAYTYCSRSYDDHGVGGEQRVLLMADGSTVTVDGIDGDDATWDTADDLTWRITFMTEQTQIDVNVWAGTDRAFRTADDEVIVNYADYAAGVGWLLAPAGSLVLDGNAHHLEYR